MRPAENQADHSGLILHHDINDGDDTDDDDDAPPPPIFMSSALSPC